MVVKAGRTAEFRVSFIPPNPETYEPFLWKGSVDLTNTHRVHYMEVTESASVKRVEFSLSDVSLADSGFYTIELVDLDNICQGEISS